MAKVESIDALVEELGRSTVETGTKLSWIEARLGYTAKHTSKDESHAPRGLAESYNTPMIYV